MPLSPPQGALAQRPPAPSKNGAFISNGLESFEDNIDDLGAYIPSWRWNDSPTCHTGFRCVKDL